MRSLHKSLPIISLLLVLMLAFTVLTGCGQAKQTTKQPEYYLKVAASSSQMTCLAKAVGGEKVLVKGPIVPPTICPGHFDLKPSDVADMKDCSVLFAHTFEPFVDKIVENIGNPEMQVAKVEVIGSWMAPVKQKEAALKTREEFKRIDPEHASYYEKNTEEYIKKIDRYELALKEQLKQSKTGEGKVICHEFQKGLMEWMGFEVVGTYPRPDQLTPAIVKELIDKGRAQGVSLVVDHMQSGPGEGKEIAESIGAANLSVSFFPGGLAEDGDYFAELQANVDLVLKAWDQKRPGCGSEGSAG